MYEFAHLIEAQHTRAAKPCDLREISNLSGSVHQKGKGVLHCISVVVRIKVLPNIPNIHQLVHLCHGFIFIIHGIFM